jgi:hypothetical protein
MMAAGRAFEGPPGPPGHGSPLNYYVPGLVCLCLGGMTLLTTWTGRRLEAGALPRLETANSPHGQVGDPPDFSD